MARLNENPEEDERKIGIGGSVGCLTLIVIGFVLVVGSFVLVYFFSHVTGQN